MKTNYVDVKMDLFDLVLMGNNSQKSDHFSIRTVKCPPCLL